MLQPWYNNIPLALFIYVLGLSIYKLILHLSVLVKLRHATATCQSVQRVESTECIFIYIMSLDNCALKKTIPFNHPFYFSNGQAVQVLFTEHSDEIYPLSFAGYWRRALAWLSLTILIVCSALASYSDLFSSFLSFNPYSIQLFLSLFVSIGSFYLAYEQLRWLILLKKDHLSVYGTVMNYKEVVESSTEKYFHPIVHFVTATGTEIRFVSSVGYGERKYMPRQVRIIYNTKFPEFAAIEGWINLYGLLIFWLIFGLFFGITSFYV